MTVAAANIVYAYKSIGNLVWIVSITYLK